MSPLFTGQRLRSSGRATGKRCKGLPPNAPGHAAGSVSSKGNWAHQFAAAEFCSVDGAAVRRHRSTLTAQVSVNGRIELTPERAIRSAATVSYRPALVTRWNQLHKEVLHRTDFQERAVSANSFPCNKPLRRHIACFQEHPCRSDPRRPGLMTRSCSSRIATAQQAACFEEQDRSATLNRVGCHRLEPP